jgi:ABC-type phosphate/phosphonate transport system substrate-binding protein
MKKRLCLALLLVLVLVMTACQPGGSAAIKDKELNVLCTPQEEWAKIQQK